MVHVLRRRLVWRLLVHVGHLLLRRSGRLVWGNGRRRCMLQRQRGSLLRERRLPLGQGYQLLSAWGLFVLWERLLRCRLWCLLVPLPVRRIGLRVLGRLIGLRLLGGLPGPRRRLRLVGAGVVAVAGPRLLMLLLLLIVLVVGLLLLLVLQVCSVVRVHADHTAPPEGSDLR